MKILIFIDDFSATGVVVNAIAIARHLHERGCVVQLMAAQAEGALIGNVPHGVSVAGMLPTGKGELSRRMRLRRSALAFRQHLKSYAPDVLFSAGNHGHLLSVIASLGLSGCRTIVRISNDLDHMINGKPTKPSSRWWRVAKFRAVVALADQVVFVSRHMARSQVLGAGTIRKAAVIPNGVDVDRVRGLALEEVSNQWLDEVGEQPLVLAVGRLALQKNFANLLRAIAIARQSRPLRLLLIGSGPLQEQLLRDADALGIRDAVKIMQPVANPMPYLARASVVALPSWWEGSSNVLLEAIACGTPVVASRTAGNAEDVLDCGRYGLLVDPDDVEGMAAALLIQSSAEAQLPGDRAQEFDRAATLRAYGDLILGETGA